MLVGWAILIPYTLLLYVLALVGMPTHRFRPLFRLWCRTWVLALGVRLRLLPLHDRPLPPRFLLIANHPSAFEDIGIPALFDADSLAKVEVRSWFLVGRISEAAGTLYVRRDSRVSRGRAGADIQRRLAEGRNVALYPEGGVKGMRVQPFRYGVFRISLQTGIPIVPVLIRYRPEQDFYWNHQPLPLKLWQIMRARGATADYLLLDAIEPTGFNSVEDYCETVYRRYLEWQREYLDQE